MSAAQHTPGASIKQLAEAAQMMPWDKSQADVPHSSRHAFGQAITADHYLEVLEALEEARTGLAWYQDRYPEAQDGSDDEAMARIDAAIAKAVGQEGRPA